MASAGDDVLALSQKSEQCFELVPGDVDISKISPLACLRQVVYVVNHFERAAKVRSENAGADPSSVFVSELRIDRREAGLHGHVAFRNGYHCIERGSTENARGRHSVCLG